MALGVPRLDQLITQLDSISGKFDSNDDLNKLEFTKPNLEQLDNYASNLDALDSFGNFDAFGGFFVRQGVASITSNATVTATAGIVKDVSASISTSASVTSGCARIQSVASSVFTRAFYTSLEKGLTLSHSFSADTNIASSNFTRNQSVVLAFEVILPSTVDTACTLFELGGTFRGTSIGFHDTNTFRFGAFRGNNDTLGIDKIIYH